MFWLVGAKRVVCSADMDDWVVFLFHVILCACEQHTLCPNSCLCAEISCGPPLILPHTNLLWDRTSRPGSVVLYECVDGFYQEGGNNISTCLQSGEWGKVFVKCKGTVTISLYMDMHLCDLVIYMTCWCFVLAGECSSSSFLFWLDVLCLLQVLR